MIGPITDSCALFVGGLAGTLFSGFIPKRVKGTLPLIFGVITLCMGSTLVNKASALPVVVMALIVGSVIGELVFAESFLAKCIRALFRDVYKRQVSFHLRNVVLCQYIFKKCTKKYSIHSA